VTFSSAVVYRLAGAQAVNGWRAALRKLFSNYKSIDWLELIHELEDRGYSKEDAVEASEGFQQEIETYFEIYPK
jgi:hypothetical protein